jgi:hypothetical protein
MSSTTRDRRPEVTVTFAGPGDAFGSAGNFQARIVLASTRIGHSR